MANLLPMFFEFYALAGRDTAVRDFLKHHFQRSRKTLLELIEQGIERGEFPNIDTEQATLMLVAVHEGLELMWLIDPEAVNLTALKEQAIHQLLASLE
jgi:AcrR family transcriptional regulator